MRMAMVPCFFTLFNSTLEKMVCRLQQARGPRSKEIHSPKRVDLHCCCTASKLRAVCCLGKSQFPKVVGAQLKKVAKCSILMQVLDKDQSVPHSEEVETGKTR